MQSPPPEILYGWRGVDTANPQNRRLIKLEKPLRDFNSEYMNISSFPTASDALALLPEMEAMWCALSDKRPSLTDSDVLHESFASLIQAASKVAQTPSLMGHSALATFVERVLTAGSSTLRPEMDEEKNAIFDGQGSWGSPSGRVEAAEGMMFLVTERQQISCSAIQPSNHCWPIPLPW